MSSLEEDSISSNEDIEQRTAAPPLELLPVSDHPPQVQTAPSPLLPEPNGNGRKAGTGRAAPDPRSQSPEIQLFRAATGRYPARPLYQHVIRALQGKTHAAIAPYLEEWCLRGYRLESPGWVTWVAAGKIPPRTNGYNGKPEAPPKLGLNEKLSRSMAALGVKPGQRVDMVEVARRYQERQKGLA